MIRRDAIKSLGIMTAGIVSGATLITEVAEEVIRIPKGVSPLVFIAKKNFKYISPPPKEFEDLLAVWN